MHYVHRNVKGFVDPFITLRYACIEGGNLCLNKMNIRFTEKWKLIRNESVKHTHSLGIYALAVEVLFVLIPSQKGSEIYHFPLQYTKSVRFYPLFQLTWPQASCAPLTAAGRSGPLETRRAISHRNNSLQQCLRSEANGNCPDDTVVLPRGTWPCSQSGQTGPLCSARWIYSVSLSLFKIHFNIILWSSSSSCILHLRFSANFFSFIFDLSHEFCLFLVINVQ